MYLIVVQCRVVKMCRLDCPPELKLMIAIGNFLLGHSVLRKSGWCRVNIYIIDIRPPSDPVPVVYGAQVPGGEQESGTSVAPPSAKVTTSQVSAPFSPGYTSLAN